MYVSPPPGFRGFIWEPCSEQDVVVLFGRLVERGDIPVALDYSWTAFPDCIARDTTSGETIHIEFEFRSSGFNAHLAEWRQLRAASPSTRWWLVAWKHSSDDNGLCKLPGLEIKALRDLLPDYDHTHGATTVLNWYSGPDDDPRQMFEWRAGGLSGEHRQLLRQLEAFPSKASGFHLEWPRKPDLPWFTVRHTATDIECFKVHANGRIGFPFSRWRGISDARKTAALASLNAALSTDWFTGREGTKKGCDALWLLHSRVDAFLGAWDSGLLS